LAGIRLQTFVRTRSGDDRIARWREIICKSDGFFIAAAGVSGGS
jgi:hypothetical protein